LIIEDTHELQFKGKYGSVLHTSEEVSLLDLTRLVLRCRPDRVVVGEVRTGDVALNTLKALSTGTPGGLFTIHADSAEETLLRLEELILEVSSNSLSTLIGRAVDMVIFMERGKVAGTRKVRQVLEVKGFNKSTGNYVCNQL
jgi:type IV secretion system protein VirB11